MAATVTAYPPNPASVYRAMPLRVKRNDPPGSQITWIKVADASDASTHGNGLQVGQVFMRHATVQGSVPLVAGQTLNIYEDGGPYAGVWKCINTWGAANVYYTIIDAPALGDYTPSGPSISALRVWLDNYAILAKLLIYTDPTAAPQEVVLRAEPIDAAGNTTTNVDVILRDYFNYRIDSFIRPMPGVPVQSAHGITAIFYRLHIVEVFDGPAAGTSDPFDGTHDVAADGTGSIGTMRVGVNAVHPYAGDLIDWSDADMSAFVLGTGKKVLTTAPRGPVRLGGAVLTPGDDTLPGPRVMALPSSWMWLHVLTPPGTWTTSCQLAVVDLSGSTPSLVGTVGISVGDPTAAIAVGYGPGNLGIMVAGLSRYSVILRSGFTALTEPVEVAVDLKCSEVQRPFAWLNKLGGIDAHTFTGREIYTSKVKRATVRKPYSAGTGYDWRERTYRAEPERTRTVSTRPLPVEYRRWLAEDMCESANVVTLEHGRPVPVVLLTDELQGGDTRPVGHRPFTVEYRLGVDNLSQQA